MSVPVRAVDPQAAERLAAERGRRYRKTQHVTARRLREQHEWRAGSGEMLAGRAGDVLVSDGTSQWTVRADIFEATYEQVPGQPDTWRKAATTTLVQMTEPFRVDTLEGPATGGAGDYLAVGDDGDAWPVSASYVRHNYLPDV